jgi:hypothetical protein
MESPFNPAGRRPTVPTPRIPRILFRIGAVILVLGTGPLVAYVHFGPADGNPVGLGLLFTFTFPFAVASFLAGWGLKALARRRGAPLVPPPAPLRSGSGKGSGAGGHWP